MTLEQRLIALAQAIGADIKALKLADGDLTALATTVKDSLVAAINELHNTVANLSGSTALIDDSAGDGNTSKTWSADKIHDSIEAAKTAVKDELVNGAGAALDTLNELAQALNNDPNFAATIAAEIGNRVRYDQAQSLDTGQKQQARTNIGALGTPEIGNPDHDLVQTYTAAKQ